MVALSIDAMLPALSQIANSLNVIRDNDRQLVISVLFIGFAIGQVFYGPIADSLGRRGPILFGFALFIVGSLAAVNATSYNWLLFGRFLQGLGAAGPRIITVAMIRDRASGREMAKLMSLVMMVFILVPAIAPAIGQLVLLVAEWPMIFVALGVFAGIISVWFYVRQPETLAVEDRRAFSLKNIQIALVEICTTRTSIIYTLSGGMIFGAFLGFINSAQQILQELYGLGTKFPFYFAILALTIGAASFVNSRLVSRFGMRLLTKVALWVIAILALLFLIAIVNQKPSLWILMSYLGITFFAVGLLFGNMNSLAMEPLGHIAGMASSVIGSVTTVLALTLGYLVGVFFDHTVVPLTIGFGVLSVASLLLIYFIPEDSPAIE